MAPPEVWGPPTWIFLHVLVEKMNESRFNILMPKVFHIIKRICAFLPCPECSKHATAFLNKIKIDDINTKEKFIGMLYLFHNSVNFRKKKNLFNFKNVVIYKKIQIIPAFNNFSRVYNTKGNMNLLNDSFQRDLILSDLRKWLKHNIIYFIDNERNRIKNEEDKKPLDISQHVEENKKEQVSKIYFLDKDEKSQQNIEEVLDI